MYDDKEDDLHTFGYTIEKLENGIHSIEKLKYMIKPGKSIRELMIQIPGKKRKMEYQDEKSIINKMETKKLKKNDLRVIAVFDKQKEQYIKSIPLEMDSDVLYKLFKPYTEDPLAYGYDITPEMAVLLEKYIEFDFKRFKYTMEENVIREIAVYDRKTKEYEEIGIPLKIDFDILNQLFQQYEDDPLLYGNYEVTPKLLKELKKYIVGENDLNFDFKKFIYLVEAYAME